MIARQLILALGAVAFVACSEPEPVATSYKKSMGGPVQAAGAAPGTTTPTTTPAAGGTADPAAQLAQGQTLYASKCAACHGAIAASQKKGATAARITASASITQHATVKPFPTAAEITALELALK